MKRLATPIPWTRTTGRAPAGARSIETRTCIVRPSTPYHLLSNLRVSFVPPRVSRRTGYFTRSRTPRRYNPPEVARKVVRGAGALRRSTELRQDLLFEEPEETFLIGTDLVDINFVVSGLFVLADRLQIRPGVGAAGRRVGDHLLGDDRDGLLEMLGGGELLGELSRQPHVRPQPVDHAPGLRFVLVPANLHLAEAGLVLAGLLGEVVNEIRLRGGTHVAVPDLCRDPDRLGAEGRDVDGRRLVGQGVEAGVLHGVVLAVVALVAALPQQPNHAHRLLHHLQSDIGGWPVISEYVLVEVLAAADAEPEASLEHRRRGGCRLGDDRRVDADGGAGDAGAEAHPLGGGGDPADHRPHERALALLVDPGVVVVRDPGGTESHLLRPPGVADEIVGRVLFAGEHVAHLGHRGSSLHGRRYGVLLSWYTLRPGKLTRPYRPGKRSFVVWHGEEECATPCETVSSSCAAGGPKR